MWSFIAAASSACIDKKSPPSGRRRSCYAVDRTVRAREDIRSIRSVPATPARQRNFSPAKFTKELKMSLERTSRTLPRSPRDGSRRPPSPKPPMRSPPRRILQEAKTVERTKVERVVEPKEGVVEPPPKSKGEPAAKPKKPSG